MSFKKLIYGSIPLLIVILGITYLASGFSAFPDALVAWGTLMLALATFILVRHSEKQEQRRREDEQQIRDEERHRLALERIRNWAEGVIELVTRPKRHKLLGPRKLEYQPLLHIGGSKSPGILKDAELVGHNIERSVGLGHLILFKFDAMLRTEKDIATFKAKYGITDTIKPISDEKELGEIKRELITALLEVINRATEQLVPPTGGIKQNK